MTAHKTMSGMLGQAKDAISLAMKDVTPEAAPASAPEATQGTGAATPEKLPVQKDARRYGQRERTQVVLYSPGREGPQLPSASAAKAQAPKDKVILACQHACNNMVLQAWVTGPPHLGSQV